MASMLWSKHKNSWMDKKTKPIYKLSTWNPLRSKETYRLKVKERKKIFHANGKGKKAGVATFISDKLDLKTKAIVKDKDTT